MRRQPVRWYRVRGFDPIKAREPKERQTTLTSRRIFHQLAATSEGQAGVKFLDSGNDLFLAFGAAEA